MDPENFVCLVVGLVLGLKVGDPELEFISVISSNSRAYIARAMIQLRFVRYIATDELLEAR